MGDSGKESVKPPEGTFARLVRPELNTIRQGVAVPAQQHRIGDYPILTLVGLPFSILKPCIMMANHLDWPA